MLWYLLPILLVLLVSAKILWDWKFSDCPFHTPLPHPYRDRNSQEEVWKHRCQGDALDRADALLRTLCDAFSFNSDDRYRFAPTDRIRDIYQACYPRWRFWIVGDSMEIESLCIDLSRKFAVEAGSWHADITLGEIVRMMQTPMKAVPKMTTNENDPSSISRQGRKA